MPFIAENFAFRRRKIGPWAQKKTVFGSEKLAPQTQKTIYRAEKFAVQSRKLCLSAQKNWTLGAKKTVFGAEKLTPNHKKLFIEQNSLPFRAESFAFRHREVGPLVQKKKFSEKKSWPPTINKIVYKAEKFAVQSRKLLCPSAQNPGLEKPVFRHKNFSFAGSAGLAGQHHRTNLHCSQPGAARYLLPGGCSQPPGLSSAKRARTQDSQPGRQAASQPSSQPAVQPPSQPSSPPLTLFYAKHAIKHFSFSFYPILKLLKRLRFSAIICYYRSFILTRYSCKIMSHARCSDGEATVQCPTCKHWTQIIMTVCPSGLRG